MAKVADLYPSVLTELSAPLREQLQSSAVLWMPNTIIANNALTPGAKFLYSVLLNQSLKKPLISPTQQTLANEIGASVRATRNYIDELRRAKLLTLRTRAGKPGVYIVARH